MIAPNPFPALLTNFYPGACLTHVGTEGVVDLARATGAGTGARCGDGRASRPWCAQDQLSLAE
jgi:hypothetical protein